MKHLFKKKTNKNTKKQLSDLSLNELLDLRYRISQEIVKKEMSRKELNRNV